MVDNVRHIEPWDFVSKIQYAVKLDNLKHIKFLTAPLIYGEKELKQSFKFLTKNGEQHVIKYPFLRK